MKKDFIKIRTRYAPSPTGYLHIGGARTALFNYLFAKHFQGDFIVRIEDTDTGRNILDGESSQLNNLQWLNIKADESPLNPNIKYQPYRQSERTEIYKEYVKKLINEGFAYPCFCTKEELEQEKNLQLKNPNIKSPKYNQKCRNISCEEREKLLAKNSNPVYRLKIPKNKIYQWNDLIRSNIQFHSDDIEDFVIARSDFNPTYNFGVVIDDHLMEITHVLRGEEHISNTAKQLTIYEMLNWTPPMFGHLTIITNEHKQKLSKRDVNTVQFIHDFKVQGFLPETIINYLSLLGWTPDSSKEFFNMEELIKLFNVENLSKSPSQFDLQKMEWINGQYIKKLSDEKYLQLANNFLNDEILAKLEPSKLNYLLLLFKKEILKFNELNEKIGNFDKNKLTKYDVEFVKEYFNKNLQIKLISDIKNIKEWNENSIMNLIKNFGKENQLSGKNLYMPIRIFTSLSNHGPEIAKTIYILGKELVLNNIKFVEKEME